MTTATENQITTPADEAEAEAQAEELFAEAAAAREGSKDDGLKEPEDGAAAVSKPDDETGQGAAPGDDGSTDEPGKKEDAAVATPASGSSEFDWSKAPPEARAAFEAAQQEWDHKLKSANGRVSVLDRKLSELRKGAGGDGEQGQPRKPLKELLNNDQVKQIGEEYPDFKPVLESLAEIANRVDGVTDEVGQVKSATVAVATSAEEKALNQAVPNWLDLARDDRFLGWVEDQPRKVRDAVAANWDGITDATAAAEVFKSFAEHIAPSKQEGAESGGSSKRDRQQSGARAAAVNSPTSAGGDSDDPDVAFAQAAAKVDRRRGLRT